MTTKSAAESDTTAEGHASQIVQVSEADKLRREYGFNKADIEAKRTEYAALDPTTPVGYISSKEARISLVKLRTGIKKKHDELKAESLARGRLIDSVANEFTALVVELEEPLALKIKAVDDEKARIKAEKEEAERKAIEAEAQRQRDALEAKAREEREREEARLAAERERLAEIERQQKAEREKLEAEKRAIEEERARAKAEAEAKERAEADAKAKAEAAERAERDRIEAEAKAQRDADAKAERDRLEAERAELDRQRRELAEQKAKADSEEAERQARIKAEENAKAKAERDRIQAEADRLAELERLAEMKRRREALLPDLERVRGFATAIRALEVPEVRSLDAREALSAAFEALGNIAGALEQLADLEPVNTQASGAAAE